MSFRIDRRKLVRMKTIKKLRDSVDASHTFAKSWRQRAANLGDVEAKAEIATESMARFMAIAFYSEMKLCDSSAAKHMTPITRWL